MNKNLEHFTNLRVILAQCLYMIMNFQISGGRRGDLRREEKEHHVENYFFSTITELLRPNYCTWLCEIILQSCTGYGKCVGVEN